MDEALIRKIAAEEARRVGDDLNSRLRGTRHENDDHLNRGLLVSKLKPGTTGYVVGSSGTDTEWAPGIQSILTTRGDLLRRGASAAERVALGTAGQVLASDGTDAVWEARAPYRVMDTCIGRQAPGTTNSIYMTRAATLSQAGTAGSVRSLFYIKVSDHATNSAPSFKAKLRAWVITEADPADSTVTATLYRSTSLGATGTLSGTSSIGAASITGVNAATTSYTAESGELTINTDGWYMVGFAHSVNPGTTLTYGYELLAKVRP